MRLRQIPTSQLPRVEIIESSESESELDYTDSESSDPDFSEEDFLCDIAIISSNTLPSSDVKFQEEEITPSVNSNNTFPVEPYCPLDHCNIFESSSSDSCPSPLTPAEETSPIKNFSSSDALQVLPNVMRNRGGNETRNISPDAPSTANSTISPRDRSPLVLKTAES